jgi:Tfp pilus assembly PilM family ATPase
MALLGAQFVVALEPSSVAGAAVSRGLGAPRIRSLARVPLTPGALAVSPFDANVQRADEVRDALSRVAAALRMTRARTCVVLPDGVARLALLEIPPGADAEEYARFKLSATLAYPAEEALVDVLPVGGARVVAAAVRRRVVEDYERLVREAGLAQDRVDLAPLAAMAALARADSGPAGVDLILGETALSLAARLDGLVRAFRNRRRDPSPG